MLKKFICLSVFALSASLFAAPTTTATVTLRPGPADGNDVMIDSYFWDQGYFRADHIIAESRDIIRDRPMNERSLLRFDLSSIVLPEGAVFKSAALTLSGDSAAFYGGHYGTDNAAWLVRVTQAWDQTTVTFPTQPAVDEANKIALAHSSASGENFVLDVSGWISYFLANPSENHGFMLRLQNEVPYNGKWFASSNHGLVAKRPRLEITYTAPATTGNPGNGKNIRYSLQDGILNIDEAAAGSILDAQGNTVWAFDHTAPTAYPTSVNLAFLAPGDYILKFNGVPWARPFKVKAAN